MWNFSFLSRLYRRFGLKVAGWAVLLLFGTLVASAADFSPDAWISQWTCIGPFPNGDDQGLERDWLAEFGGEPAFQYRPAMSPSVLPGASPAPRIQTAAPNEDGFIDFREVFGMLEFKTAYAWCELDCPEAGFAFLKVGSDDGVKVWINGVLVHEHFIRRGAQADQDIVVARIQKGANRCLVKVEQATGAWGFFLRFGQLLSQKEGVHLKLLDPIRPPVILLGARYPIVQSLYLTLLNHGTKDLEEFQLVCRSEQLQESRSEKFSCPVGRCLQTTLALEPQSSLRPGAPVDLHLEARLPGGERLALGRLQTEAALIHPLLQAGKAVDRSPFYIVQISDPHLVARDSVLGGVKTAERLEQAVAEINAMTPAPDFVVVTGDILLDQARGYPLYESIMAKLNVPYVTTFGNHDKPAGLDEAERVFSAWRIPPYYAFDYKGYAFVVLDSVAEVNPPKGEISEPQRQWLDSLLGQLPSSPWLFFLHHELFTGTGTTNQDEVQTILEAHPGEKWFFTGHWHADCFVKRGNQRHVVTTATAYLFFNAAEIKHDRKIPGYRLIHFHEGNITTEFKPLGGDPLPDPGLEGYYTAEDVRTALGMEK